MGRLSHTQRVQANLMGKVVRLVHKELLHVILTFLILSVACLDQCTPVRSCRPLFYTGVSWDLMHFSKVPRLKKRLRHADLDMVVNCSQCEKYLQVHIANQQHSYMWDKCLLSCYCPLDVVNVTSTHGLPGKAGWVGGGLLSACLRTTTSPSLTP